MSAVASRQPAMKAQPPAAVLPLTRIHPIARGGTLLLIFTGVIRGLAFGALFGAVNKAHRNACLKIL